MRANRIEIALQKFIFLLAAAIVVCQALGLGGLTSLLFTLTFPVTVALWMLSVRQKVQLQDLLVLITAALAVVSVVANACITGASLSFDYLRKLIMFIMSLLFLQTMSRTQADWELLHFIRRAMDGVCLLLIVAFFYFGSGMFVLNGMVTPYLTFRFTNPNTTGLFLTCLFVLQFSEIYNRRGFWSKAFHLGLAAFMGAFILLTRSRNALIVSVLFTAAVVWLLMKSPRKLTMGRLTSWLVAVFPLLFAGLYSTLLTDERFLKIFAFLISEGKKLNSREVLWENAWEMVKASPIVGVYSQMSGGTGMSQMHNTHVDVLASYGVGVMVLLCCFLYRLVYARGKRYDGKESFVYMLGFVCAMILGMGEAALFSGGLGIYIFVGGLLLLSKQEGPEMELCEAERTEAVMSEGDTVRICVEKTATEADESPENGHMNTSFQRDSLLTMSPAPLVREPLGEGDLRVDVRQEEKNGEGATDL